MLILFKMRACKCLLKLIRASFVAIQQHRLIDGLTIMFFWRLKCKAKPSMLWGGEGYVSSYAKTTTFSNKGIN